MATPDAGEPVLCCPFCDGTSVEISWVGLDLSDGVSIECQDCGARGSIALGDREKNELILDAITSWNTSSETDLRPIAKLIQVE